MRLALLIVGLALGSAWAEDQVFPPPGWQETPSPMVSPEAVVGGEMRAFAGPYPKSLNYYLDSSFLSADIFNALNLGAVTGVYNRVHEDGESPGPDFGEPTGYQSPFRVQLGIRYQY